VGADETEVGLGMEEVWMRCLAYFVSFVVFFSLKEIISTELSRRYTLHGGHVAYVAICLTYMQWAT
jgi:hypothetical protein